MYVYMVLNKINGKYYIGKTSKTIEQRWNSHIKIARSTTRFTHFYLAIRKYGIDNFELRTIFRCEDRVTLDNAERYFIGHFCSTNPNIGYNSTAGGDGGIPTQEVRNRMSHNRKGKKKLPFTEEHKQNISKGLTGLTKTPEERAKMSATRKGRKFSDQTRERMRNSHTGTKQSESHRKAVIQGKLNAKQYKKPSIYTESFCF